MSYPIIGGSAMFAVQAALFSLLTTDAQIQNIVGTKVFDGEPEEDANLLMPYILIGELTEVPNDRLTTTGNDLTVLFHVYSNYEGVKEILLLANAITRLLNHRPFPIEGFVVNHVRPEFHQTLAEPDGIRHGLLRYRIKVQPLAA